MKTFLPMMHLRKFGCFAIVVTLIFTCNFSAISQINKTPNLVVGIVVDQMRTDYIYRFWNRFGEGGFKRLINNGFFCRNTHYNYVPTYTGPGHCSIYTGCTPSTHGIIANEWYSKEKKGNLYCTEDETVQPVGSQSNSGKMSPRQQLTTTLGDELKLATNGKSKIFGVALKDRSSILPVGHAANAAFWFDDASGNFISSSWYMKDLPDWVKKFNEKKLVKAYLDKGWNTLYPIETYTASISDDNKYEAGPKGLKPIFPYNFTSLYGENNYGIIKGTPWGNSITKDIALECLKNEQLGKDNICDMLCISFSSTDIVGHSFGLRAIEIEDVYLRLDKDIEEILNALDAEAGKDNYTVFLTSDHGAADVANYLKDLKIPAGLASGKKIEKEIKLFCKKQYGDSLILNVSNQQIFLSEEKISSLKLSLDEIERSIANQLLKMEGVAEAYPSFVLKFQTCKDDKSRSLVSAGYNFKRSGNVAFTFLPAWMDNAEKGTTHGASYGYDTHVPLLFYGCGIKKGENINRNYITEIAPTLSILMNVAFPNGCVSQPIEKALNR